MGDVSFAAKHLSMVVHFATLSTLVAMRFGLSRKDPMIHFENIHGFHVCNEHGFERLIQAMDERG